MKKLRRIVAVILSLIMVLGSMTNVFAAPGKYDYKFVAFSNKTADGATIKEFTKIEISNNNGIKWEDVTDYFNWVEEGRYVKTKKFISGNNKVALYENTIIRINIKLTDNRTATVTIKNRHTNPWGGTYYQEHISGQGLFFTLNVNSYNEDTYSVTYTAEEGVTGMPSEVTGLKEGAVYTVTSVKPVKEGYTFVGWSYNNKVYTADETITIGKENVVLKAVWNENTYSVTYTAEEGVTGMPSEVTGLKKGDAYVVADSIPEKANFRFAGWLYNDKVYAAGDVIEVEGDIVLQAAWTKLYKIIYVVDGDIVETKDIEAGKDVSGYAEYKYTNVPASHNISDWTLETTDANLQAIDKDIVVSAKTSIKTFTVTYYIDGSCVESFQVNYGEDITLKDAPTYDDKNFVGWDVVSGTLTDITEDVVIVGSTSAKVYTVKYKVDGVVKATFSVEHGLAVPDYEYTPGAEYDFSGWTEKPATVTEDIVIEGTTTLKKFTVKFVDANGKEVSAQVTYGSNVELPKGPNKSDLKVENGEGAAQWIRYTFDQWAAQGNYGVTDLYSVKQDMTFVATYKESPVKVYYYILNRGMAQPNEPASHDSKDYSKKGVEGALKSFTAVANNDEKVKEVIFNAPEASDFGITLNDGEYIKWYVVKSINADKWHVDGIIVGQQYDLVVDYVDAKTGESIKESTKSSVAATENYEVEVPEIEGYKLVDETTIVAGVMPYDDVKVTVEYEKIQCTVTYMVDGKEVKTFTVEYGDEIPTYDYEAPEGYNFSGFELTELEEDTSVVKQNMVFEGTTSKKIFKITYYLNGEVFYTTSAEFEDSRELIGSPAGEGQDFSGWTCVDGNLENITEDVVIVGSTTVKEFTVTYKVNGETVETLTVKYGEEVPTIEYEVQEGYEFFGFELVTEVEDATVVKNDLVFEGTTAKKTFTVTYTVDGEVVDEYTVEYGSEVPASTYEVAEGYEFSGWSKVPEKVTSDLEINGTTTIKTFTVIYTVDGAVVDEFTVEYGSEVPASTYEVPEGYEFTGFELVEEVEDATVVKQDMAFEGTTSLIVVEEEEEEDIESDIPFAPGTTEEEDNNTENDETVTDDVEEEEEEDLEIDTPFAPGTTEEEDNSTENNESVADDVDNNTGNDVVVDTDNNKENDVVADADNSKENDVVDTDNNTVSDVEEEEEEDLEIDTPFDSGVQTGDASNYSAYVAALLIAAVGAMVIAYNKKKALN